jgi:hypothetical protein
MDCSVRRCASDSILLERSSLAASIAAVACVSCQSAQFRPFGLKPIHFILSGRTGSLEIVDMRPNLGAVGVGEVDFVRVRGRRDDHCRAEVRQCQRGHPSDRCRAQEALAPLRVMIGVDAV